jgi:non-ribosomal peptide synthetase component F
VALGYLGNTELTEKFRSIPALGTGKFNHTRDLGVMTSNGDIECLRRIDNEVKILGHRIDITDILSHL